MKEYGMFTDAGNAVINDIVEMANKRFLNWATVMNLLTAVSQEEVYSEATDTAVREAVWDAVSSVDSWHRVTV